VGEGFLVRRILGGDIPLEEGIDLNIREKSLVVLFLVTLLPLTTVASAPFLGSVHTGIPRGVQTRVLGGVTENFTTSTYEDSGNTDAAGWGTGVLTSPRDYSLTHLDTYTTSYPVRSIDVQGRKVYFTHYPEGANSFQILNITDPGDLQLMDTRNVADGLLTVEVEGDMACMGTTNSSGMFGFAIYNVSNPYDIPLYLDMMTIDGNITDIEIQGRYAYVVSNKFYSGMGNTFRILDIADPTNIIERDGVQFFEPYGVFVDGHIAYIANGEFGLNIVNVSDAYSIGLGVGYLNTPGNSSDVLVEGNLAYIADGPAGVRIVNVRDPTNPTFVGTYDTAGFAYRLALQGDTLYVADGTNGLVVLDVSHPQHPLYVDSYALSDARDVALYGGVVVVGSGNGVYTFQIGSMDSLSYVGAYSGGNEFWDVKVRGNIAYVAAGADGILTVDVSNPSSPVLRDQLVYGGSVFYRKIDVQGHLAFVADYGGGGLRIFDVSNPNNIVYIGTEGLSYATDVAAWGHIVFVADGTYGVYVVDVTNPSSPFTLDFYDLGTENVTAVWVQGYHLYAVSTASAAEGFSIFDIRDPSNIDLVWSWAAVTTDHYDIYVDGDVAFIQDADANCEVWNVTDPTTSYYSDYTGNLAHMPLGTWGFGPYMLAANYSAGVALFDTSNINDMQYVTGYAGASQAIQITTRGDYAYVANRTSLVILRLFKSAAATYVPGTYTAQSTNLQPSTFFYVDATLTVSEYVPLGVGVNYYLSADGGLHWEALTCGVAHTFAYPGLDIRWKVNFTNPYNDRSAHIYEVTVSWNTGPPAANPLPVIITAVVVIIVIILVILLLYLFWYRKREK
jgi:hypothetical protein